MKIGLDLRFWRSQTGGLSRYSQNLLVNLLNLDPSVRYTAIITPADEAEFLLDHPNIRRLVVPINHFSLSEQVSLPRLLSQEKFDLVHFSNFNHPLFFKGRFVITIHDLIMDLFPSGRQKRSPWRRLAYNLVINDCQRAERIIVPSQATKLDLVKRRGFDDSKIVVIEDATTEKFRPHSALEQANLRRRLNLPERYLLFVSRWEPYKGIVELLEAYERLSQKDSGLGLVICGRPSLQSSEIAKKVAAAQEKNHRIVTPGFVTDDELATLYSGATVYVHPSRYEGFGIMILEAFACGAPVVSSRAGSLSEVVGKAGLLVAPGRVGELTEAISKILRDEKLADSLRQSGFARVKRYSWLKAAEKTLEIYRRACNDS